MIFNVLRIYICKLVGSSVYKFIKVVWAIVCFLLFFLCGFCACDVLYYHIPKSNTNEITIKITPNNYVNTTIMRSQIDTTISYKATKFRPINLRKFIK